jgi:hypothetical protein
LRKKQTHWLNINYYFRVNMSAETKNYFCWAFNADISISIKQNE